MQPDLTSSSEVPRTTSARLPWAADWLACWSDHPSTEIQAIGSFAWRSPRASQAMSLQLYGEKDVVPAGYAWSESCGVFVAGELYNQEELSCELSLSESTRDAEFVLSAWRAWGPDAFNRLDGLFAIMIHDSRDGRLWAARDPMGGYPLFFAKTTRSLVLSNTIPSLLRHMDVSREINRLKLAQVCYFNWGEPHETFYKTVHRVPPAHFLQSTRESWKLEQYWSLPEVRPAEVYPFDEAFENYSRQIDRVVARRHQVGQPSILLSGGVDSISVAMRSADISRSRGQTGPLALSLLFTDGRCDERPVQEAVARALGLSQVSMTIDTTVSRLGLVEDALALSRNLSAPLWNTWRPAYVPLIKAANGLGNGFVLTGQGGDEWLGASPLYMADLIKRGRFLSAARTLREQFRSFSVPLPTALRFQLWNSGLRPLFVPAARSIVTNLTPSVARAIWRRRQDVPMWVAPEEELNTELRLYLEQDIERQFSKLPIQGRYGFYTSDAISSYIHPLVSSDREEDFEIGKLTGQRLDHPYWDARLIRCLFEIPPEWLSHGGYSKGLVRGRVAERFPGLGLERKKKVSALSFSAELMSRELPVAWDRLGGLKKLSELGVINQSILDEKKAQILSTGVPRQLHRLWFLLIVESWLRAHM